MLPGFIDAHAHLGTPSHDPVTVCRATNSPTSRAPIRQLLVALDARPLVQHGVEHRIRRHAPLSERRQRQAGFLAEALAHPDGDKGLLLAVDDPRPRGVAIQPTARQQQGFVHQRGPR